MNMLAKLIKTETRSKSADSVSALTLDSWHGAELSIQDKALLETFPNLKALSIRGCGLISLRNFPTLPALLELELSSNQIAGGLEHLSGLSSLRVLHLRNNPIKTIPDLAPLVSAI